MASCVSTVLLMYNRRQLAQILCFLAHIILSSRVTCMYNTPRNSPGRNACDPSEHQKNVYVPCQPSETQGIYIGDHE